MRRGSARLTPNDRLPRLCVLNKFHAEDAEFARHRSKFSRFLRLPRRASRRAGAGGDMMSGGTARRASDTAPDTWECRRAEAVRV